MSTRLYDLREEYRKGNLEEVNIDASPFQQFSLWFDEAEAAELAEPNAMILSTVGKDLMPSSRIVLLKNLTEEGLTFFTNYQSRKATEIEYNAKASLLFPWHEIERQVRIEGEIEKVSESESDDYFAARPLNSRIGAWASPQSRVIPSRKYLEDMEVDFRNQFDPASIPRPPHWGGFRLKPVRFEFWQGRESRLHDRIQYLKEGNKWVVSRLAP